jgi:hypothetical protein
VSAGRFSAGYFRWNRVFSQVNSAMCIRIGA